MTTNEPQPQPRTPPRDVRAPIANEPEHATLGHFLGYLRESLIRKTEGLTDLQVHTPGVQSGTSLAWLLVHLAAAENNWFVWSYQGEGERMDPFPEIDPAIPLADLVADYRAACVRSDEVVAGQPDLDALGKRSSRGEAPSLRWVLVHMIEETARHAGHADILRERIDGTIGR